MEGVGVAMKDETREVGGCQLPEGLRGARTLICRAKEDRGCRLTEIMPVVTWKHLHLTGQPAGVLPVRACCCCVYFSSEAGSCFLLQKDAPAC